MNSIDASPTRVEGLQHQGAPSLFIGVSLGVGTASVGHTDELGPSLKPSVLRKALGELWPQARTNRGDPWPFLGLDWLGQSTSNHELCVLLQRNHFGEGGNTLTP
jgi:hypothetical protein